MNTVSITSKYAMDLNEIRSRLARHFRFVDGGAKQLVIEKSNSRVYIYHPEPEASGAASNQLFLDYSSEDLVKRVIETIADDPQLTVENDFGEVLPGNEFVAKIKSNRGSHWYNRAP